MVWAILRNAAPTLMSAGTTSPSLKMMTSPGTNVEESTVST